jgi:hypothetical protein
VAVTFETDLDRQQVTSVLVAEETPSGGDEEVDTRQEEVEVDLWPISGRELALEDVEEVDVSRVRGMDRSRCTLVEQSHPALARREQRNRDRPDLCNVESRLISGGSTGSRCAQTHAVVSRLLELVRDDSSVVPRRG